MSLILALLNVLPLLVTLGDARPVGKTAMYKREVPQELSHKKFLTGTQAVLQLDNPAGIVDPVFGLLGDAAASEGAGTITNLACLQQATADQAFTNAKADNDIEGMTNALMYRAIERNTGQVGLASAICDETAVNLEIDAITQHQDPASDGAAEINKGIVLALAQQLASIGADPQLALESGTFAPGDLNDNTGAGNTCDDADDEVGCIFTRNLLVEDASAEEIDAAVAGGGAANAGAGGAAADGANGQVEDANNAVILPAEVDGGEAAGGEFNTQEINIGQCTDFSITFAPGLEGRAADEFTFIPTDQANFPQGSALNPRIITNAMCDGFVNGCGQSASTQAACETVKADIDARLNSGALTQDQAYADAWLAGLEQAFGIQSSSSGTGGAGAGAGGGPAGAPAAGGPAGGPGAGGPDAGPAAGAGPAGGPAAGGAGAGNAAHVHAGPAGAGPGPAGPGAGAGPAGPGVGSNNAVATEDSAGGAGGAGGNVQTFTGALNGATATPVIETAGAARPFSVGGDTFVNKSAAIQRSCAQQANACANAFNSGAGNSNVAACREQETQCIAAGGA